jgi:hypothetical protein
MSRNRCLLLFGLLTILHGLLSCREARAEFWRTQGTKPGPFMFNLKFGGAFSAYYYYGTGYGLHQFALQTDAGFAVTPDRNGYIVVAPQFEFGSGLTTIMLPAGFQYDIHLPLKGLYIYPRVIGGFAALVYSRYYDPYYFRYYDQTILGGFFAPEFGAKYVLWGRLNFGAELFSLPVFFSTEGVIVQYRVFFYGGINL